MSWPQGAESACVGSASLPGGLWLKNLSRGGRGLLGAGVWGGCRCRGAASRGCPAGAGIPESQRMQMASRHHQTPSSHLLRAQGGQALTPLSGPQGGLQCRQVGRDLAVHAAGPGSIPRSPQERALSTARQGPRAQGKESVCPRRSAAVHRPGALSPFPSKVSSWPLTSQPPGLQTPTSPAVPAP